jgi:hypothetical protein
MSKYFSFLVLLLAICLSGCYKKYDVDETLHISMLDPAYSDYHDDSWFYFLSSNYVDNSLLEDVPNVQTFFYRIPDEHLIRTGQSYASVSFSDGTRANIYLNKDGFGEDVIFTFRYLDPVPGTTFNYSIGALDQYTGNLYNVYDDSFFFE